MARLKFSDIYKRFHDVEVLHGVSFSAAAGRVLGLVGENGSGKSTCMNIIGGIEQPTSGMMTLNDATYRPRDARDAVDAGIAFVHQELNLFPNLTIEENLFIDAFPRKMRFLPLIDRRHVRAKTSELLRSIELRQKPTTEVGQLSQGERQMVEIAKGLHADASLIILDEPTTSLTHRERDKLFEILGRLRDRNLAVIYISHILEDVLRLADDIVVLRDGSVTLQAAANDVSTKMLVEKMVGREISQLYPPRHRPPTESIPASTSLGPDEPRSSKPRSDEPRSSKPRLEEAGTEAEQGQSYVEVSGLSQPGVVHDISFTMQRREILGLSGLMGSGRTELARMLFGLDRYRTGSIYLDGQAVAASPIASAKAGMALVTEDRRSEGLLMPAVIRTNVSLASYRDFATPFAGILRRHALADKSDIAARQAGLGHESPLGKIVQNLSGGNQQKVVLAKWMMRRPKLLILDEPTRGVDIGSKEEIYQSITQLADEGSAVLMISSEMDELIGMCDRILVMNRGEIAAEFPRPEFDMERIMHAAWWHCAGAAS